MRLRLPIALAASVVVMLACACSSNDACANGACAQAPACSDSTGECSDAGAVPTGGPCSGPSDCDPRALCAFPIADGCNAKGVCVATSPPCLSTPPVACACDGTPIGLSCIYGKGNAPAPMKSMGPCEAAADAASE